MNYIWINPVVEEMYAAAGMNLNNMLEALGYIPLVGDLSILEHVKQQFVKVVEEKKGIILDTRCPLAISKIQEGCGTEGFYVPEIYPILIQTSFELYERYIANDKVATLHIMCPCTELSVLGNKLAKKWEKLNLIFYPWNEWVSRTNIPKADPIGSTPIPLGFFDGTNIKVKALTGEEVVVKEVDAYRSGKHSEQEKYELIEMLYCKGGCHNGNGVV